MMLEEDEALSAELRARANARRTSDEPSPTAQLCARAADRIETLVACLRCDDELRRPAHFGHVTPQTMMGRPPKDGEFMHVVGNFSGVAAAREAMGIDWMTRDELREAIPPAYTRYIGEQLLAVLTLERAA